MVKLVTPYEDLLWLESPQEQNMGCKKSSRISNPFLQTSQVRFCAWILHFRFFLRSSHKSPNMSISIGQNPTQVPEIHHICDATISNPFLQTSQVRFVSAILDFLYFFTPHEHMKIWLQQITQYEHFFWPESTNWICDEK